MTDPGHPKTGARNMTQTAGHGRQIRRDLARETGR